MNELDLHRVRHFVVVAEELHFGRAAERLHVAQPALSMSVRKLEDELGLKLFERNTRRVELTRVGRAFLHEATQVLAQSRRAVEETKRIHSGRERSLRIGFTDTAMPYLMTLVRGFHSHLPAVPVSLHEQPAGHPLDALLDERVDLMLASAHVSGAPGLSFEIIGRERIVALLPTDHRLAAMDEIPIRDLANEPFIMLHRHIAPRFYDSFIGLFTAQRLNVRVIQGANEVRTIAVMVGAGLGLTIGPMSWRHLVPGGAVTRPARGVKHTLDFALIHRGGELPPIVADFISFTKASLPPVTDESHPFIPLPAAAP